MITADEIMTLYGPAVTDKVLLSKHSIEQIISEAFTAGQAQGRHDGMTESATIIQAMRDNNNYHTSNHALTVAWTKIKALRTNPEKKETI